MKNKVDDYTGNMISSLFDWEVRYDYAHGDHHVSSVDI